MIPDQAREENFVRRGLCLLCALMVLFGICPAWADENAPMALDLDLGFSLDPTLFPAEYARDAEGWAELLEKVRLSGSWIEARNGSDCFDIDLKFSVTDKKTASVPLHVYGPRNGAYIESPLLADQRLYFNFAGWLKIALKMYDYFEIPLQEPALLLNFANDFALQKLKDFWAGAFPAVEGETHYTPDQLKETAAALQTLLAEDTDLADWITAVGIRSGLDTVVLEEAELLDLYVDASFPDGLTVTRSGAHEKWTAGETTVLESDRTDAESTFELHLPATPGNGVAVDVNRRQTAESMTFSVRIASARETYLDLNMEGTPLPESPLFTDPFSVRVRTGGYMTGDLDCRITGETGEADARALTLYLKDADGNEKEAFRVSGTIRAIPDAGNPFYDGSLTGDSVYLTSLTEFTLAELTNKVAGAFVRGILPVLVEVPPLSCQVILDELTDCGILQLLSSDFELER